MTVIDLPDAPPAPRPEPARDRWGRYIIPHPDTGKPQAWVRATTLANTLADTFALTKWELRMSAVGLARRSDLLSQVATVTDPDDPDAKKLLNKLTEEAKEAGGASVRRNLGTALHAFTEHLDAGRDVAIPDAHRADLDAYQTATAGLDMPPEHIEQICVVPSLGVAGTFDRLARLPDGRLVVADLKTGSTVHYGMGEIAIQLALYANATHTFDPATGELTPMPAVDRTVGIVIHLPAGSGRCDLHEVDLVAGWEMAQTAATVREWRRRKDLSAPFTPAAPKSVIADNRVVDIPFPAEPPADRDEWISGRIRTLGASTAARQMLKEMWPAGTPRRPPWTPTQHDDIIPVLDSIETAVQAPWPHNDPDADTSTPLVDELTATPPTVDTPATPPMPDVNPDAPTPDRPAPDNGGPVDDDTVHAAMARYSRLGDRKPLVAAWSDQAKATGHRWGRNSPDDPWTERAIALILAAMQCARHLWDDEEPETLTRAALAVTLDQPLEQAWPTGAVIGTLTVAEATQLEELAARYGAGDKQALTAIGEALTRT